MRELFSSQRFWIGFVLYIAGLVIFSRSYSLVGGVIMLVSALMMMNEDYKGRKKVLKRLRWIK
jgi:hypothetical protein